MDLSMHKEYIAPVDYNPTEPGGLCISKNDRLVFIHVGDGWCLGKNLTKGGQEGIFPKLYLGTSRSGTSNFNRSIDEIAIVCSSVDELIAESSYLSSEMGRASLQKRLETLHSLGPFSYLTSGCAGGIWEQCLGNFVSAFQEAKVKAHEYVICVEKLKRHAAMLDKWIPILTDEICKYDSVLPTALRNAECMHATLKGLISAANQSFELYKPRTCLPQNLYQSLIDNTKPNIHLSSSTGGHFMAETHIIEHVSSDMSPTRFLLMSYPTLQVIPVVVCIIATFLQIRAYSLSSSSSSSSSSSTVPGHLGDADFYNNLQSTLMQSLTTCTGLVPAIRMRALRGLISVLWVSLLSVAGLVLNFSAMGIYFHDAAMAPLLSFF